MLVPNEVPVVGKSGHETLRCPGRYGMDSRGTSVGASVTRTRAATVTTSPSRALCTPTSVGGRRLTCRGASGVCRCPGDRLSPSLRHSTPRWVLSEWDTDKEGVVVSHRSVRSYLGPRPPPGLPSDSTGRVGTDVPGRVPGFEFSRKRPRIMTPS